VKLELILTLILSSNTCQGTKEGRKHHFDECKPEGDDKQVQSMRTTQPKL
jgi:hypothetical protein